MANKQRHQKVIEVLAKQIFMGRLKPGDKLPSEKQLSERLKVDRTSLRLGLKQLEAMKVLSIRQGDGIYVRDYVKDAGLDFLGLSLEQQEERGEGWSIDPYLVDEIWEFWTLFAPVVAGVALKKCSTRDLKYLAELLELQKRHIKDRKKVVEIELLFQDKIAEVVNNTILLLFFNSIKQIRRKATQILVESLDEKGLKGLLETKRDLIEKAMSGSEQEIARAVEIFRNRCIVSRQNLREFMSRAYCAWSQRKSLAGWGWKKLSAGGKR